jgi:chaperonin cofactor prefoldin
MDDETKNKLDALGAKIDGFEVKVDGLEVKVDGLEVKVDGLEVKVDGLEVKVDGLKSWLMQRLDDMAASLEEGYRDTQTELLKAIYTMGETVQSRVDTQEIVVASLQKRQALLEARLLEIEKRLHLPPDK